MTVINKFYLKSGILFAGLAVVLGAFGAHALREILSPEKIASYETGVRYQFYHSFALMILGLIASFLDEKTLKLTGTLFISGIILFSGSIYFLCMQDYMGVNLKFLGPATPLGGILLISGWLAAFVSLLKSNDRRI